MHKQVKISYDKYSAEVDEDLVPLILACWKNNIDTGMSCQENFPGVTWLHFFDIKEGQRFLSLASGSHSDDENSLYQKIKVGGHENPLLIENKKSKLIRNEKSNAWHYRVLVDDYSLLEELDEESDSIVETVIGPPNMIVSLSIRFPKEDLEQIISNLNENLIKKIAPEKGAII